MKKQRLLIVLLPFLLTACGLGAKKMKNIAELTPKLSVESNEAIQIDPSTITSIFTPEALNKNKEYSFTTSTIIAEPVFNNNIIYTISKNGKVSAFSRQDNTILWSCNVSVDKSDNYFGGGILYYKNKLYVTYGARSMVILDSQTGHEIVRKELLDISRTTPVLINDHTILVQTISNQALAVNIDSLNFVWQHEGTAEILSSSYHTSPIAHNGYVIVNYSSGQIFALNADDGQVLWVHDLSNEQEISLPNFEAASTLCKPIINKADMYLANSAGKVIKVNIMTGDILWQTKAEDVQSMSLSGNNLFITNNAGQIAIISTNSGKVKFVADLNELQDAKKVKVASFLAPIISQTSHGWNINIISTKGVLYTLQSENNILSTSPQFTKIVKNIEYYGKINHDEMYFSTNKKIIFVNSKK